MAIVLGKGGVMIPFKRLARMGLGGRQGSGQQMFSWIHIEDLCRIIEWLWERPDAAGVYNASAPAPVTNSAFMKSLRQWIGVPVGLPAPKLLLSLGAALIGTEPELLLKSRWVLPGRLFRDGFRFRYDDVADALRSL